MFNRLRQPARLSVKQKTWLGQPFPRPEQALLKYLVAAQAKIFHISNYLQTIYGF